MQAILNIGIRAARRGGAVLLRERSRLVVNASEQSFDKLESQVKWVMHAIVQKAYPDHAIDAVDGTADVVWHMAIDGFANLVRDIPHAAIVILIKQQRRSQHALIYDPYTDEIFTATAGTAGQCNDYRLRVSCCYSFKNAILSTSLLQGKQLNQAGADMLAQLNAEGAAFYHQGCPALSLAYVAAGRIDAFFACALEKTIIDAGVLLVNAAGGLSGDWQGGHLHAQKMQLVAANAKLFRVLLPYLRGVDSGRHSVEFSLTNR